MDKYLEIKKLFEQNADNQNAISMAKYMRNMFVFYGIASPIRKELYNDFLKREKKLKIIDWDFLDKCYADSHREFQYLVSDYLLTMKNYVTYEDISKIKKYIVNKSWWDTIDFLCKVIGNVSLKDTRVKELMISWSKDNNFWLKRTALEYQLGLKDKTDINNLSTIIINSLGSNEFFINKAIGWVLRDYSKTNPKWVKEFINQYYDKLSNLSIKEASKYL